MTIRLPTFSTEKDTASSMDSFLDDYQAIRLLAGTAGLASLAILGFFTGFSALVPYLVGLALTVGHASWIRFRAIRAPKSLLAIDTTVWGGIVVLTDDPVTGTAILALLVVLVVAFSDGWWRVTFLAMTAGWYAFSYFGREGVSVGSIGRGVGALLIIGSLVTVMARIRTWLGRLEANRSQLLGTVSHELRNNLTAMMGLTDIVSTDTTLGVEEARELVGLAHQQAVDAGEIVEDLLIASRLKTSALSVTAESVDVTHEVAVTVKRFASEGVALSVEGPTDLPPASADSLRVRQILRNLISNAIRYGGSNIRITTDTVGDTIRVVVADDGDGVPAADVATIFLPYRRSGRTHDAASVGLGLWISQRLAAAMHGSLEYCRTEGWTNFVLTLQHHPGGSGHTGQVTHRARQPADR